MSFANNNGIQGLIVNNRKFLKITALSLIMTGCASSKPVEDTTPLAETSILEAKYSIGGFILPDSKGSVTIYTQPERRAIKDTVKYDSWLARQMIGNADKTMIARVDKNLQWHLDHDEKAFYECPLSGCSDISIWDKLEEQQDNEEEGDYYDPSGGDSCKLTSSDFKFNITPKDKQRTVNGFKADQYVAQWTMTTQDEQGLEDKHVVKMDFWMTKPDETTKEMWDINGQYNRNYLSKVSDQTNPLSNFFNNQIFGAISMISGDIEKKEMDNDSEVVQKLKAIPGYPVSIKLEWFADSQACQQVTKKAEKKETAFSIKDPLGSLTKMAEGIAEKRVNKEVEKRTTRDTSKPMLSYIYDVTNVKVQQERGSRFEVPKGYKLTDRQ
jgi:hypothetical protein